MKGGGSARDFRDLCFVVTEKRPSEVRLRHSCFDLRATKRNNSEQYTDFWRCVWGVVKGI